jgi:hypothetical protein
MTDLVTDLIIAQQRLDAFNASGIGKGRDIAHAFDAANKALRDEIERLRIALATAEAEIERLTEKAIVGEYMWTPEELDEAVATARKEADDRLEIFDRVVNNKATMWSEFDDRPKVTITFDEADEAWRFIQALADMRTALAENTGGDKP